MGSPPLGIEWSTVLSSSTQKFGRHSGSRKNFGRVRISGGSKKTFAPRISSSSCALVHHPKNGGKQKRKVTPHFRLSRVKSVLSTRPFQVGSHATYFSNATKRHVGSKNRPKARIFSRGVAPPPKKVHAPSGRHPSLGISGSMFWLKRPSTTFYETHENISAPVAPTRHPVLHLPRRYSAFGKHSPPGDQAFANIAPRLTCQRHASQLRKVHTQPHTERHPFGVHFGLKEWLSPSTQRKIKKCTQRAGKVNCPGLHARAKNGGHFGPSPIFFDSTALSSGFHGSICGFTQKKLVSRLEFRGSHTSRIKSPSADPKGHLPTLVRSKIRRQNSYPKTGSRLFRSCLGRSRFTNRTRFARILAQSNRFTHKRQRNFGSHTHSPQFGSSWGKSFPLGGQYNHFLVLKAARGPQNNVQSPAAPISNMVSPKRHTCGSPVGEKCRNASGQIVSPIFGPGRLHSELSTFSAHVEHFSGLFARSSSRYVCQPRQPQIPQICQSAPSLASNRGGCLEHAIGRHTNLLQQPPVEHHPAMAIAAAAAPPPSVLDGCPLLGFKHLVSPVAQANRPSHSNLGCATISRNVSELHRAVYEGAKVAPSFLSTFRKILQREQMPLQVQNSLLAKMSSTERYDAAFRKLYALCTINGIHPEEASVMEIAGQIVQLCDLSQADARNAYSACLLLPGLNALRCNVLLQKCRKTWSAAEPKYSEFWEVEVVLQRMAQVPLQWASVPCVRARLLLVFRLFHLMRSVDCSRIQRTISFIGDRPFILVRRKGWSTHRWEEIISLPLQPSISPWHLLRHYVHLTQHHAPPGSQLFLSLHKPFTPLTSDRIASLTKSLLQELGVAPIWGPHSTRGAGVAFYKRQGMSTEQVAEIGKWKDIKTFSQFYLRLQAAQQASSVLSSFSVHTVSPLECAEPDMSQSPPRNSFDGGRSDMEGGAQNKGETSKLQNFDLSQANGQQNVMPKGSAKNLSQLC